MSSKNINSIYFSKTKITGFGVILFVLLYSNILNIANYSFLSYNFNGGSVSNPLFAFIRYSRLPVLLIGVIIAMHQLLKDKKFESFIVLNYDVILFGTVLYFGLFNSIDLVNGALYTVWQTFALLVILIFYYYLNKRFVKRDKFRLFFQFIFWSNFIVLPLLIINLQTLGNEWTYYMSFSSKTFYPYCALSMMLAIYMCNLMTKRSLFSFNKTTNRIIETIIILLLLFFVFLSARRTPLIIMFFISFFYLFSAIGNMLWKKIALGITICAILLYSVPRLLNYMEVHKYELSVLKKLADVRQSGGNLKKDGSYNERLQIWDTYLNIFKKYPIIGVGSYNSIIHQKRETKGTKLEGFSTHNLYLGILVEHGLIGILLFFIMIFRSATIALTKIGFRKTMLWVFYLLMPVLVINWAEYNLIPGQVFYWTTFLIILFPRMHII